MAWARVGKERGGAGGWKEEYQGASVLNDTYFRARPMYVLAIPEVRTAASNDSCHAAHVTFSYRKM